MPALAADIAIIGAGIAGASLAATIGGAARVVLIEAEAQPGYHATGRSAAFWSESYGGPVVRPLTGASGGWLESPPPAFGGRGFLAPRGCVHIADAAGEAALDRLAAELAAGGIASEALDRPALDEAIPGLRAGIVRGVREPTCRDIDVAALHAACLSAARRAGTILMCDAAVESIDRAPGGWRLATRAGPIVAAVLADAAGAWAGDIAAMAGAAPITIAPYRRTIAQLAIDPPAPAALPLVMDALGRCYFKPDAGGRLWLSPHDESPVDAHDVAPEELDVAIAIDRLERIVDWRVLRRERAWAGLRSFAPDRAPVYGFDRRVPGFFWFAGQGGFGIQTAPAAAMIGAALLLDRAPPEAVAGIDIARFDPARFG